MGVVRLGKMLLRWCHQCHLPILAQERCGSCSSRTTKVSHTPPGDIRPAFEADLATLRERLDTQFGMGCGEGLAPEGKLVVLNRAPALDRMDEVIIDGEVMGALRYEVRDPDRRGLTFVTRLTAAHRMLSTLSSGWVKLDEGVETFILDGASVLLPGVASVADDIAVNDEVIVLDSYGDVVATGRAKMTTEQMRTGGKGVAVKTRWRGMVDEERSEAQYEPVEWADAVDANRPRLDYLRATARALIERVSGEGGKGEGLPVAVSFSGGKDSLATLLLVLETEIEPMLLFIDTGLELPETVEHVHAIAEQFGLPLLIEEGGESFWDGLEQFGPPGRDFRWCCKSCKLGPATRLIYEHFPNGVLSFIGQRRYESMQRARSPEVWRNPWVPGQLSVTPIQQWTALDVWLYIFQQDAPFNEWYRRGMERIGCWLCPASSLADLDIIRDAFPGYERWERYLAEYAAAHGYPQEWVEAGLWRWKSVPKGLRKVRDRVMAEHKVPSERDEGELTFAAGEPYSPCGGGISVEGAFSRPIDLDRVRALACVLGQPEPIDDHLTIGSSISVFGEGAVTVNAASAQAAREAVRDLCELVYRAELCIGCGVCVGRCEHDALRLNADRVVVIDGERCTGCKRCLSPCPVTSYRDRDRDVHDGFGPEDE